MEKPDSENAEVVELDEAVLLRLVTEAGAVVNIIQNNFQLLSNSGLSEKVKKIINDANERLIEYQVELINEINELHQKLLK